MKVLVLGVTGMLGSMLFRYLSQDDKLEVWGSLRNPDACRYFPQSLQQRLISQIDVLDEALLEDMIARIQPTVVINCVGIIKQLAEAEDPLVVLPINAMFPHRLQRICSAHAARLIHISTDCVFSGSKGMYREQDLSDAEDLYGKSKYIGELHNNSNAITLRTSIIGHELASKNTLIEWFLAQSGSIKGYTRAIFSGLPTVELSHVIKDFVLPKPELQGLYHVSAAAISKFDLLSLVAGMYGKKIEIIPDDALVIDRSLNSERFQQDSGYRAPGWPELIGKLQQSKLEQD